MGRKQKNPTTAGRHAQNPSEISKSTKIFFQLLQCMHHLTNIGNPHREGIKAKAFLQKFKDLDSFVRPAMETNEFKQAHTSRTKNYILDCLASLRDHYLAQKQALCEQIQNLGISVLDYQTCSEISLKWAKKNFRTKLRSTTISEFKVVLESLLPRDSHFISNTAHLQQPSVNAQRQKVIASASQFFYISAPDSPASSSSTLAPAAPATPATSIPDTVSNPTSFPFPPPSLLPKQGTLPAPPVPAPAVTIVSITPTRSLPAPSCAPANPSSVLPTSPAPATPLTSEVAPLTPAVTNQLPSFTSQSSATHNPLPVTSSITSPVKPPLPNTPSLSPKLSCSSVTPSPGPSGNHTSTSLSTSTSPPTSPKPQLLPSANDLFDLSVKPLNVRGEKDVLSNFFPFTLKFRGQTFRSVEHAYQYEKAMRLNRVDKANEILMAKDARAAKDISKSLQNDPDFGQWETEKMGIMKELLFQKVQQLKLFKTTLLDTSSRKLTHDLTDKYWGSTYRVGGKVLIGDNHFARLLMKLRHCLSTGSHFDLGTSQMNYRRASLPSTPPQQSYRLSNRFSPLQNDDFPALPEPRSPGGGPLTSPPSRRPRRTRQAKVNWTSHRDTDKKEWRAPVSHSKVLVLGDSNLQGFGKLKVDSSVGPVECHSYPGAKLRHFTDNIWKNSQPQLSPQHVILSVGINNRNNMPSTHRDQLKRVVSLAQKTYPNAQIYIPQINYASNLEKEERASLDSLNSLLMELSGSNKKFHTISKLSPNLFTIGPKDPYKIHWTNNTAESMLTHWIRCLN